MITKEQKETLSGCIDNEGFNYTFTDYSGWGEIKDEKFHALLKEYVDAENKFKEYLKSLGVEFD